MLHYVTRHDVIGGHQAFIHRFMGPRFLHLAKTTRGSRDACVRQDYKLASREQGIVHWSLALAVENRPNN